MSGLTKATGTEARVCDDIARRQLHGINKYGITVAENPISERAWLQHAYEEALDFAVYLRRLIEKKDEQARSVVDALSRLAAANAPDKSDRDLGANGRPNSERA